MADYIKCFIYIYILSSLVAQSVKSLPAMQETQVQSLGQEDPLASGLPGKCQPTPVFLHGEFHEQRSLVSCSPQGHKESDMTD